MEQLVIFMCWFNKNLGKQRTADIMNLVQQIRMSNSATLSERKLKVILMWTTKLFTKRQICDRVGISMTAVNNYIKQAEELNFKALRLTNQQYDLMVEFMNSFDKLCRARNLMKGTLEND